MSRHHAMARRLSAAAALLLLAACGRPEGRRPANLRPSVRLTGGPVQGDSVSYTSEFFWAGWDRDGVIDHYQYAIDIPDHFSLDDINNPADVGIAWVDTTAFRGRFLFTTPVPDSVIGRDGRLVLPERYRGDHTFYVRSVDNEGASSEADFLSFTARTVTPRTRLVIPKVAESSQILLVGRQFAMGWEGLDPDALDAARRPASYEWKLVPVEFVLRVEDPRYALLVTGRDIPWVRVGADTTFLRLNLNPPQDYVAGVRAIDVAGGIEDHFYWGQNALRLISMSGQVGTPVLTVKETTIGEVVFPGEGDVVEFEVPVDYCLRFDLTADVDSYGGVLQGYNWGVDVPDVEDDGPTSGFRGWTLIPYTFPPICFSQPGVHTVTFKCRDTGGGMTIGTLVIRVVGFPRDRDVLYLDDHRLSVSGKVNDRMMDARAVEMLRAAGYSEVFQADAFGPNDAQAEPSLLRLSDMTRYKLIVWSVLGSGYGGRTALLGMNACARNHLLQVYVAAGGGVWIYGQRVFATMKAFRPDMCIATLDYHYGQGLDVRSPMFPCLYMHLCGGDIRDVRDDSKYHGLLRAIPTAKAQAEQFPAVELDSTVFNVTGQGAIPFVDAMFGPTYVLEGGLDTLYTMDTPRSNSPFRRKPVAFRYFDPDPNSRQGPVALFGFPFHVLKQGSGAERTGVQGMARSMVEWFRAHGAGPAGRGQGAGPVGGGSGYAPAGGGRGAGPPGGG